MAKGQADPSSSLSPAAAAAAHGADGAKAADKHAILGTKSRDNIVLYVLYAIAAVSLIGDFVIHRHVGHPWEALPEFYPLYAFVSIIVLIFSAKALRKLVMRPEDYYDD